MSHLPITTPSLDGEDGPHVSFISGQDDGENHRDRFSPLMQDTQDTGTTTSSVARTLGTASQLMTSLLIDFVSISVSIAFLAFAILGYNASGNVIGSREEKILDIARIVYRPLFQPSSISAANTLY